MQVYIRVVVTSRLRSAESFLSILGNRYEPPVRDGKVFRHMLQILDMGKSMYKRLAPCDLLPAGPSLAKTLEPCLPPNSPHSPFRLALPPDVHVYLSPIAIDLPRIIGFLRAIPKQPLRLHS